MSKAGLKVTFLVSIRLLLSNGYLMEYRMVWQLLNKRIYRKINGNTIKDKKNA